MRPASRRVQRQLIVPSLFHKNGVVLDSILFSKLRKLEALAETELPTMILFVTRGL